MVYLEVVRTLSIVFLSVISVLCLSGAAVAEPTCAKSLGLKVGAQWAFQPVTSPLQLQFAENPAKKAQYSFPQPERIVLRVLALTKDGKGWKVEETIDGTAIPLVYTCTSRGLLVPPQSLLFSAEPAGGSHIVLSNMKRSGVSFPKSLPQTWTESLTASFVRTPPQKITTPLAKGSLGIRREVTRLGKEVIASALGSLTATKFRILVTGSATVSEPASPKTDISEDYNFLWIEKGKGLVQFYSQTLGHMYQVAERK